MSEFPCPMYPQSFPSLVTDSANGTAVVEKSGTSEVRNQKSQHTASKHLTSGTFVGDYRSIKHSSEAG